MQKIDHIKLPNDDLLLRHLRDHARHLHIQVHYQGAPTGAPFLIVEGINICTSMSNNVRVRLGGEWTWEIKRRAWHSCRCCAREQKEVSDDQRHSSISNGIPQR